MKPFLMLLVLLIAVNGIIGCAGSFKQLANPQSDALVVGYLGTDKSPCYLDYLKYKQTLPNGKEKNSSMLLNGQIFYAEFSDIPGSVKLTQFGGHPRVFSSVDRCDISFPNDAFKFEIKEPGKIYFLGAIRAIQKEPNIHNADSVHLEVLEFPDESEVLQMLLPTVLGTKWESVVKSEIQSLKKPVK